MRPCQSSWSRRPFAKTRQFTLLCCLLRHWHRCCHLPRWQKILCRVPVRFDYEPVRETIYCLMATDGDWQRACELLRGKPFAPRLFDWAKKHVKP